MTFALQMILNNTQRTKSNREPESCLSVAYRIYVRFRLLGALGNIKAS